MSNLRIIEAHDYHGYIINHVEISYSAGSPQTGIKAETIPISTQWQILKDDEHVSNATSLEYAKRKIDEIIDS